MKLPHSFFDRPTLKVAHDLIGCYLVRKQGKKIQRLLITETEAYDGPRDKASHASRGKTLRNSIMFERAGHIYVYFTYGIHWMLNIVTGAKEYPAAVLIRGVQTNDGTYFNGPAKLTEALGITGALNKKKLGYSSELWVEKAKQRYQIIRTPRIGVAYAGAVWANKKYRFVLK